MNLEKLGSKRNLFLGLTAGAVLFAMIAAFAQSDLTKEEITYFPPDYCNSKYSNVCNEKLDLFDEWYLQPLRQMNEPSLWEQRLTDKPPTFRFVLLPSMHINRVAVRIIADQPNTSLVVAKELAISRNHRASTDEELSLQRDTSIRVPNAELESLIADFSDPRFLDAPLKGGCIGFDGSQWVFKSVVGGNYKIVDRWTPNACGTDEGDFFERLGDKFLSIAKVERFTPR